MKYRATRNRHSGSQLARSQPVGDFVPDHGAGISLRASSAMNIHLDGVRKQSLETGRNRLLVMGTLFALAFLVVAMRLVELSVFETGAMGSLATRSTNGTVVSGRASIVDRNGIVLATSLPTASVYAEPHKILDSVVAAEKLASVLPGLSRADLIEKLRGTNRFIWVRRNLTPKQIYDINRLGIPGIGFRRGEKRVYPHGRAAAHILGMTDVDGRGIAGVEKYFDQALRSRNANLQLSLDLRVQSILREELSAAKEQFNAIGAAGVVLDVNTGEIVAMTSLPDFDPNTPALMSSDAGFNRAAKGVYEMGSTFKLFTLAMALDSGTVGLNDGYDASQPIRVAKYTITDFHGKNRWLSVPEILIYSSNIGAAKMAMDVGEERQRDYLGRLGLLKPLTVELPEIGTPLTPSRWRDINTMTISYGHGIAVTPLQLAGAVSSVVNGGVSRPITMLKVNKGLRPAGVPVLTSETSEKMRAMMRLVVSRGTGKKAAVAGYRVGGKTGSADKLGPRGYQSGVLISSFVGAFPMDEPRYVVLVVLDEPKGSARTYNYATGGWVAAPAVSNVVRRIGPLLGLVPVKGEEDKKMQAVLKPVSGKERRIAAN